MTGLRLVEQHCVILPLLPQYVKILARGSQVHQGRRPVKTTASARRASSGDASRTISRAADGFYYECLTLMFTNAAWTT